MCTRSATGTPQEPPSCTGTPLFLARNCPRNPTGTALLVHEHPYWTPSWTPSCIGTPPLPAQEPPSCTPSSTLSAKEPPPLPMRGVPVYYPIGCPGPLKHRCHIGARQCALGCIATTHAMPLRPCLESLQISVVPPRVKLCEAPRSWHHLTRPAHDVTTIVRDSRAQNKMRVRYA